MREGSSLQRMQKIFLGVSYLELFWGFVICKLLVEEIIVIVCSGDTKKRMRM